MKAPNNALDADITCVMGATGSGKSQHIRGVLLRPWPSRLIVWDFKAEYGEKCPQVTTPSALIAAVKAAKFNIAFVPDRGDVKRREQQFDMFCQVAYALGNCTVLVEELTFSTRASKAPEAWRMMTCTGRAQGLRIIASSQRPAQVDKDFLSNCSTIHCGRMSYEPDVDAMRRAIGVKADEILALKDLEYLSRNMRTNEITRGKTRIVGKPKA